LAALLDTSKRLKPHYQEVIKPFAISRNSHIAEIAENWEGIPSINVKVKYYGQKDFCRNN